jgi:hypothetical protein
MTGPLRSFFTITLAMGLLAIVSSIRAEPRPKAAGDSAPAGGDEGGWQKLFREMAEDYEMTATDKSPRKFLLQAAPVLRWSQPVRGGDDGAVYVWLDEGRPAAIGSIFAWPLPDGDRWVAHELHALTMIPMNASYRGQDVWSLEKPALEFKRVPNAAAPLSTAKQRLTQMRSLGREFTARSIDKNEREWELRLLGQPLHRYELKDHPELPDGLLDGAILSFVQGTDPEILLILEARREGDKAYWQYALARFSDLQLIVKHNDDEVWRVPYATFDQNKAPYFARNVERRKRADIEGAASKAQK